MMASRSHLPLVAALCLVVGCTFPTSDFTLGAADSGRVDIPVVDTPTADTPTADAPTVDAPAVDAPDVPSVDVADAPPASCGDDAPCPAGSACCAGACIDVQTDQANCGACGRACAAGQSCCAGACATTATDPTNCGRCGAVCDYANGTPSCAAGACGGACASGFGDCDGDLTNGCESELAASASHCGMCGRACSAGPNATASCAMGACALQCDSGRGNCDGNAANGCEVDLNSSPSSCGMCGRACSAGPNATAVCLSGFCGTMCAPGFADCDGDPANGCEADTRTSPTSCGACGTSCARPSANTSCSAGACRIDSCVAGRGNCDGDATNGCEADTASSTANCGMCGRACPSGQVCSNGECNATCPPGQIRCGTDCVRTGSDPLHCGMCGRACSLPHATAGCVSGGCTVDRCETGWADCDGNPANGCEANVATNPASCGGCGVACSTVNATATCASGVCSVSCRAGFANCDGDASDGCEVGITTDPANCGGCGRACSVPFATAGCSAGACTVASCATGRGDCDRAAANGCEVDLNADNANCGTCGRACTLGQVCNRGACASACAPGYTFCSGSCRDLQSDELNCGACGRGCNRGLVCIRGACAYPPPSNDTCSGATVIDLSAGSRVNLTGTLLGSARNLSFGCGVTPTGDVYYRFTLTRREYVYADTFGSSVDTKLQLTSSCTTGSISTRSSYSLVCNDNRGRSCTSGGNGAQVYASLEPGTYYLVVGAQSTLGSFALRFEHVPAGSGPSNVLNSGTYSFTGSTSTTSSTNTTCGGSGGEATWWWVTCPEASAGAFSARSCAGSTFDIILGLINGSGTSNVCSTTTLPFPCTTNSAAVSGTVPAGAGLHVFQVDGFGSSSTGTYNVSVTRP